MTCQHCNRSIGSYGSHKRKLCWYHYYLFLRKKIKKTDIVLIHGKLLEELRNEKRKKALPCPASAQELNDSIHRSRMVCKFKLSTAKKMMSHNLTVDEYFAILSIEKLIDLSQND
jgi:hypothetical protein